MIEFRCPQGHRLAAPQRHLGRKVRCPLCGQKVVVKAPSDSVNGPLQDDSAQQKSAARSPETKENAHSQALSELSAPSRSESPDEEAVWAKLDPLEQLDQVVVLPFSEDLPWWSPWAADPGKIQSARMLAWVAVATGLLATVPGVWALGEEPLPLWAVLSLAVAGVQLAFALWVLLLPDWLTTWVLMAVYALSGAGYAAVAVAVGSGESSPLATWLELAPGEPQALGWSVAQLTLCVLITYGAGRLAARWHTSLMRLWTQRHRLSSCQPK